MIVIDLQRALADRERYESVAVAVLVPDAANSRMPHCLFVLWEDEPSSVGVPLLFPLIKVLSDPIVRHCLLLPAVARSGCRHAAIHRRKIAPPITSCHLRF